MVGPDAGTERLKCVGVVYQRTYMSAPLERYTFDDDGRLYTNHDDLWLPSVSTVLGVRDTPPGLQKYLDTTSQSEQDQKTFYTQNRGTLIHWHLLSQVDDVPWTDDEQTSKECLKGKREHEETGLTGDYETWQRFENDREWAEGAWSLIRRIYGINPESVIGAELFVRNEQVGYAGQFDLLYTDYSGDVVLADLKTSKRVYDKHLLQCVAYKHAVDIAVDRMEVIRINPDSETWVVSRSDEWIEDEPDLWDEFVDLREQLHDDTIESLKDRVQSDSES